MKKKLALLTILALAAVLLLTACSGAKFSVHKVTFDADGGDLGLLEGTALVQTYGMVELPTPTKEGYVFLGWYLGDGVNEAQFTATSLVTADITLKAKWTPVQYTVTFVDYYGEVLSREIVKYGEELKAPVVPRIADKCLRFDSWSVDLSTITTDTEVKAQYVVDSHTVTYVTGTNQTIPTTSYFFGETPIAPAQPTRVGHYFIGWYLDKEYTQEYLFDAPLTEDITLYAFFNESIPISTLEELLAIPENDAKNYFITNDIDCEGAVITTQIIGFSGTIDGCGHKIHNFAFQPASTETIGLFATNGGTIKNLTFADFSYLVTTDTLNANVGFVTGNNSGIIENVHIVNSVLSYNNINATNYFGALAAENGGTVTNCSITGGTIYLECNAVSWAWSGGRACYLWGGTLIGNNTGVMSGCNVETTINLFNNNSGGGSSSDNYSYIYFGGLVAQNNGTIKNCDVTVDVTGKTVDWRTMELRIGGFVSLNNSEIENCHAEMKARYENTYTYLSEAGFVETNKGTIKNSYTTTQTATTLAHTASSFGGFVVYNYGGIDHAYVVGNMVIGAATNGKGGFTAYNNGNLNACFADVSITATDATKCGPFVGYADTASCITNCYYSIKETITISGQPHVVENAYATAGDPALQLANAEFLTGTLGWSADVWAFDASQTSYPTLK